jgi:hypothetical protein
MQRYAIGDRVMYEEQDNNPGHMAPKEKMPGVVIAAFDCRNGERIYRVELELAWSKRLPRCEGKKIVAGNITARWLSPIV